jgi:NRAMP (natural resistance-associated macrophage protein)-like metal ion transporter
MKLTWHKVVRTIGPGFVSGAADDDPAGIATYSQAGAMFGYGMSWSVLLCLPLMTAVQYVSGRIGAATGKGLAGNLKANYPGWILYALAILVFIANTINLGADIGAMAAATLLLIPLQPFVFVIVYGVLSVVLIAMLHYENYSRYLKWLGLSLLAYVASALTAGTDWGKALSGTFVPSISTDPKWISIFVAIFGTTISPYLVFWESSQEVEAQKEIRRASPALKDKPRKGRNEMRRLRRDTLFGMTVSQVIGLFIVFTCAATLNQQGHTNIQSAAEAASALKPAAGQFTSLIFAAGIVGTGLLALPVLAGSAAFAFGECFGWKTGLSLDPMQAKAFYGVIAASTAIGVGLNLVHVNVIQFLIGSAIINGVVELPVIVMMMLVAHNRKVMGEFAILPMSVWGILSWATLGVMGVAVVAMFATL